MNKFFSLLGLCKRAGKLVAGEVAAEQAVRKNRHFCSFSAGCIEEYKKKFTNSAVYYELPWQKSNQGRTGRAIGAEMRSIIAITEKGFAKKLKELADDNIENRTRSVKADFRERRGVVECPKSEFMNWQSSLALPIKT